MKDIQPTDKTSDDDRSPNDPRDVDPQAAEEHDPHSGVSDDPRVDSTPDRRQTQP